MDLREEEVIGAHYGKKKKVREMEWMLLTKKGNKGFLVKNFYGQFVIVYTVGDVSDKQFGTNCSS